MIGFLQHLIDALALGSIHALTALGIGLLFGILRLINFAHGDLITLGAYALIVPAADVTARLMIGSWTPAAVIIAISMIVVVAALLTDAAVFRPLRTASPPTLMIASFAVSYIIQNGILMFYGARPKAVDFWSGANVQIVIGALRVPLLQLITLAVTIVLMAALTVFLRRTPQGVQMRAGGEVFRMAQYLGVRGNVVIGLAHLSDGRAAGAVRLRGGGDRRHGQPDGRGRGRLPARLHRHHAAGLPAAGSARLPRRVRLRVRHPRAARAAQRPAAVAHDRRARLRKGPPCTFSSPATRRPRC